MLKKMEEPRMTPGASYGCMADDTLLKKATNVAEVEEEDKAFLFVCFESELSV